MFPTPYLTSGARAVYCRALPEARHVGERSAGMGGCSRLWAETWRCTARRGRRLSRPCGQAAAVPPARGPPTAAAGRPRARCPRRPRARCPPAAREPDVRDAREPDVRDAREPDVRDAREPDVRDAREPDVRDAREPDVRRPPASQMSAGRASLRLRSRAGSPPRRAAVARRNGGLGTGVECGAAWGHPSIMWRGAGRAFRSAS